MSQEQFENMYQLKSYIWQARFAGEDKLKALMDLMQAPSFSGTV